MASQLGELNQLCSELRSDKPASRNKAADRLEVVLTTSKSELLAFFGSKRAADGGITWANLFDSAVDAALKHAAKVEESSEAKSIQTMLNKNHIFRGIVSKLIEYNLESNSSLLCKGTIYAAVVVGFSTRSAIKIFGSLFMEVLERGLYKSPLYVRELKFGEYSAILSNLFEMNIYNNDVLRFEVLHCIIKTIEIAVQHVQLNTELVDYLPEVAVFVRKASDDRRKAEAIKLYYLFVSLLSVDYHQAICNAAQEILPTLCDSFHYHLRADAKQTFFHAVYLSLRAIYPNIGAGDFGTITIPLKDSWPKTLRKLKALMDLEIKERKLSLQARGRGANEKSIDHFIKMAGVLVYLIHWHVEASSDEVDNETQEPRSKVPRVLDKLDTVLGLVQLDDTKFNDIWLFILSEVICQHETVINSNNYQPLLDTAGSILRIHSNASNLCQLRHIFTAILHKDKQLIATNCLPADCCAESWRKVVTFLVSESSASNEIIAEKQLLLQQLIAHGKLTAENCNMLLQSFISNSMLRRSECFETVRSILTHAEQCGFDKTSQTVERFITWACETTQSINAKSALLNIAPVDSELMADTCAIAVINFLEEQDASSSHASSAETQPEMHYLQMLQYKYNRKFVCLEEHGRELRMVERAAPFVVEADSVHTTDMFQCGNELSLAVDAESVRKNCLFQPSYELLMRALNLEISKELTCSSIRLDLCVLYKLTTLMRAFLRYGVFDEDNFRQCPLIKRIGFFLSHMESQLKNNNPRNIERSELLEILQHLEAVFGTFMSNSILLQYLETQPLEELINFLGNSLKHSDVQQCNDVEDEESVRLVCLRTLAQLCASSNYQTEVLAHITQHRFNIQIDLNVLLPLIKIFCTHKAIHRNDSASIANWFVDKLKLIFRLHHSNIDIIDRIAEMMPAIFNYVQCYENLLSDMFVALLSLLKIAYKKSYSVRLTSKMLNSVRLIARQCGGIYRDKDFVNICLSAAKFLPFPSLEIQFAVINTVTGLMDASWLKRDILASDTHFEFCNGLCELLDYKSLSDITPDLEQNRNSISIQMLIALLSFSSYYQETALQELSVFCALKKITEAELKDLQQIAIYHKCSLEELTKPYMNKLMHFWISKKYPILKYPYFLCYKTKHDFFQKNLATIATCQLLYTTNDDLKKQNKYATVDKLVELALPSLHAFLLPHEAKCSLAETLDYKYYLTTLTNNLQQLGIDLPRSKADLRDVHWETIYNCVCLLRDNQVAQQLLGFPAFNQPPQWFDLTLQQLQCCLSCYAHSSAEKQPFHSLINDNALSLLHTINALKKDVYICRFPNDSISRLCKYCTFVDLLIDSMSAQQHTAKSALHSVRFFLRDTILFLLQYLQSVHQWELRKAALTFLQHILKKPILLHARCRDIIEKHLNDISKCLVALAEEDDTSENSQLALMLLQQLLSQNEGQLGKAIALLDEFPASEQFSELRTMQDALQSHSSESRDLSCQLRKFLEMENSGVKGLNGIRQLIKTNSSALQTLESSLLHGLVEWLLRIVRSAPSMHISLEAAKCLGEIGSMRIEGISYFFGLCCTLYYDQSDSTFIERIMSVLDELLLTFDVKTYQAVCDIACLLVKTKVGADALSDQHFHYLTIFRTPMSVGAAKSRWSPNISANAIDWLAILKSTAKLEWSEWIRTFMAKVFECCGWQPFRELAQKSTSFAESAVFPITKQLLSSKEQHLSDLATMLEYFFGEVVKSLSATVAKASGREIYSDKRAIRMFLNFCESIRIDNEWNVPVNLLHIAKASNYCQAYFVSIMYLELWAKAEQMKPDTKSNSTIIGNATFQQVAIEAYQSIGCCDAIAGFINPLQSRVNFLDLNNDWSDMLVENSSAMWDDVCTSVLKRNGMLQVAHRYNQRPNATDHEILWRLGQWDHLVEGHSKVNTLNDMEQEYEKHHYNALRCLYNREEQSCLAAVRNARHCVLSILKEISIECLPSVYKYLTWLQLLQQAEDFCKIQFVSDTPVEAIFNKWQAELDMEYGSFQCKELVLAHQSTLFRTAGLRASRKIKDFYKCDPVEMCLLKSIKECKAAGENNLAKRDIATLRNMELSSEQVKLSVLLEDAEVCFRSDKLELTQAILKHVLKRKELSNCLQTVRAVRLYGEYLMESQTQTFENVLDTMFKLALQMLDKFAKLNTAKQLNFEHVDGGTFASFDKDNRKSIYQTIAKYADREYTQLQEYVNSIEFHLKCRIMKENREAAESIGKQNRDRDKNCGAVFMRKFANLDEAEVKLIEEKRTTNLCIAVENYIKLCQIDEGPSSAAIYRIIALWFANKQNETFHSKIKDIIGSVPSYKFICALNQLTARLNSSHEHFVELLKELLVRCLQDHPHHTLYHLFALVFAFNDNNSEKSNDRTSIAKDIILKGRNKANTETIKQMQTMLPALIEFANAEAAGKNIKMPLADKLKRLKRLDAVHCPTVELPVAANQVYNIISIENWQDEVSLVGGINAPKKLSCVCSDGRSRPQLLKGKDDLRQDAVMQQVFSMMNGLLRSDPKAVERKLIIRTYKVVPLSMRSGILEWCSDTIPIGSYLGSSGQTGGAHNKYRPNDLMPHKCRQLAMQHLKSCHAKRFAIYEHICANIKPVFHNFLLEKFPVPGTWFERRLAYTNSVAVNSMVGYIVGLGDRHTQNILIDEKTAELVHIDFGIAFEQGKIMPTPETVPFRLTRDMVAPMGITETNGVFKKSCETTMRVLRANPDIIMTILEVLLYDPLYIWKVVPVQSSDEGASTSSEGENLTARRALLCVQNKLEGKRAGVANTYNVDVQVQRLINDAISKHNLCLLYPGWDPYL